MLNFLQKIESFPNNYTDHLLEMHKYIPNTRTEPINRVNIIRATDSISWKVNNLTSLYVKYVSNHIVKRFNAHIINNAKDPDIAKYIQALNNPKIFTLNSLYIVAARNHNGVMWLQSEGYIINIPLEKYIDLLIKYDERCVFKNEFVIPELKKVSLTPDELIAATTGFIYTLEERFSKNSPLPKEITLKSKSGKSILIHNHVAGSVSKVLYKAIYGPFIGDKIINLQCLDQTLEWFLESAYTGVFKFDETLTDHIDGANLLDYLEVLTKENLYQLLHAELFD